MGIRRRGGQFKKAEKEAERNVTNNVVRWKDLKKLELENGASDKIKKSRIKNKGEDQKTFRRRM